MEDRLVDTLLDTLPAHGGGVFKALFPRSLCDANRNWRELDPNMFKPPLNGLPLHNSAKVKIGYGVIPRCASPGQVIYRHRLPREEARKRLLTYWCPYHETLQQLLTGCHTRHGMAILLDIHSMPQIVQNNSCDIILGDRYGNSCSPLLINHVEKTFMKKGYRVQRNVPYAGGYITQYYGQPQKGHHALQIEICRSLYLDMHTLMPNSNFEQVKDDLTTIFNDIMHWATQQTHPMRAA